LKTNSLLLAIILLAVGVFIAQVGIKTVLPKSTLAVNGLFAGRYRVLQNRVLPKSLKELITIGWNVHSKDILIDDGNKV